MPEKSPFRGEQAHLTVSTLRNNPEQCNDSDRMEPGACIEIEGPILSETLSLLSEPLLAAVQNAHGTVVIDLRRVPEIDGSGLALLLKAYKALPQVVPELCLQVTRGSQPMRVLKLAGSDRLMTLIVMPPIHEETL